MGEALRKIDAGETLFRAGDSAKTAYLIVDGVVELVREDERGGKSVLARLHRGELVGESELRAGTPHDFSAVALGAGAVRPIDRDTLLGSMQSHALSLDDEPAAEPGRKRKARRHRGPLAWLREFQPGTAAIHARETPRAATATLFTAFALIVAAVVWASLSHVDRIVTATGRVITLAPQITLQPLETAIVREIHVQVGDVVATGQLLASLDPTFANADAATARQSMVSYSAQLRRLETELNGSPGKPFSPDPSEDKLQTALFDQRAEQVASQIAVFDAEINQSTARIKTNEDDRRALEQQVGILRDLESMRKDLSVREVGTRINLLDAQRQRLAAEREALKLTATNVELAREIETARAKRAAYLGDWRAKAGEEMMTVRREIEKLSEQMRKSERRNSMVELTAPAAAVVLDVAIRSVGSVVREAEPLITLVPIDVPQEIEIELDPKDVGSVRVGDKVRIKLEALPFQRHGTVDGEIRVISGDSFQKQVNGQARPVFRGRVKLTDVALRDVPADFRLSPGMTVQAEIRVGDRRVISYFLYPILRVFDESLREP